MPAFLDPFSQNVPERKMTNRELVRAIRLDLAGELEAISVYMAHADATDDPLAKKVLVDIANEEREHVGELIHLTKILTKDEQGFLDHGMEEVEEMARELGVDTGSAADSDKGDEATIGSLKE